LQFSLQTTGPEIFGYILAGLLCRR